MEITVFHNFWFAGILTGMLIMMVICSYYYSDWEEPKKNKERKNE